jgi:AraC family transcriptional regulator, transcriptional activator FtrA
MRTVAAVVDQGALTFDLAVPCEVFGFDRRDLADPWYEFMVVAAGAQRVRTQTGFVLEAPYGLGALVHADTVVIPGWGDTTVSPSPALVDALRAADARGARIVALCTGAFVLAAAGLLDGRRATTHWRYAARLAERYPRVRVDADALYVADDRVMTSAGTAAGIDLCLHVVTLDHGVGVAAEVARRLVIPLFRSGGQARYVEQPTPDDNFGALLDWARGNLGRGIGAEDIARQGAMSQRTLARRFRATVGVPPAEWVRTERLRLAQRLLDTSDDPLKIVARRAGYGSTTTMREHFVAHLGTSPRSYRRTSVNVRRSRDIVHPLQTTGFMNGPSSTPGGQ